MNVTKAIYFDMDGTIADLYGVEGWLNDLESENERPYATAKPLIRMSALARVLNRLQREGYTIGIVSWLSKGGSDDYNEKVAYAKQKWLKQHLASVNFDEINIVKYGTPKSTAVNVQGGILFDDEERNRIGWTGIPHDVQNIMEILREI